MREERADWAKAGAEYQAEWQELNKSAFQTGDERLGQTLVVPDRYWDYWHLHNLYYKAYTEPQQLEADRVRLIYFQSAGAAQKLAARGI